VSERPDLERRPEEEPQPAEEPEVPNPPDPEEGVPGDIIPPDEDSPAEPIAD
jgi:hypothetical protein